VDVFAMLLRVEGQVFRMKLHFSLHWATLPAP
jgi:hypothetical protein